ncbi:MAG TPA: MBL fold metallo-hydrolase [Longimicrobiales bacterium]|nr:MBL fold metallo-hydrolase [Longimicrobiales bacterium]
MTDTRSFTDFLRWRWQRMGQASASRPGPSDLPVAESRVAHPASPTGEVRITWIGHSTFLVQAGGLNLLTDPIFSDRASPLRWIGPRRLVPPGLRIDDLPPLDAVLLSHDHYDHLDERSVRALHSRFGDRTRWITPLGYAAWFARRRITSVVELDWWEAARVPGGSDGQGVEVTALPARHWTKRGLFDDPDRRWASFSIDAGPGAKIYFGGDSGYFGGFAEIGVRAGPFDAAILPIGAYDPRWFMEAAHMNPEEAVRAWADLGGEGRFVAMHWGTFVLTDEPVLEPPARARRAWAEAERDDADLTILRHGETMILAIRDDPD